MNHKETKELLNELIKFAWESGNLTVGEAMTFDETINKFAENKYLIL